MKKTLIILLLIVVAFVVNAQEKKEEPKFGIKFSGFVKTDVFYDTRQTVNIREGHFLLYPDNILKDKIGTDINAKPNFNMLSIQSRLKGAISGPDAFGAKTSGVIEADFFGNETAGVFADVNGFRIRHAFVKMNWENTEILAGQYWHPMFIADVFPGVISFNTGSPFQPFSRNPQIRLTHNIAGFSMILCAYTQRDFASIGPDPTDNSKLLTSSKFMINSGMPAGHFQIQYRPDSTEHVFGIGVDYKRIVPRTYSEVIATSAKLDTIISNKLVVRNATYSKYQVEESLSSISAIAYMKLKFKDVTIKLEGVYAENATDLTMFGGFAVKEVDSWTGRQIYTNKSTGSVWGEIQTNGKKVQYGLFGGYAFNMGTKDKIIANPIGRGNNIDFVYRVAPRVVFISGKLNIAVEAEYTTVNYGKTITNKAMVVDQTQVSNLRGLLSFIYNF